MLARLREQCSHHPIEESGGETHNLHHPSPAKFRRTNYPAGARCNRSVPVSKMPRRSNPGVATAAAAAHSKRRRPKKRPSRQQRALATEEYRSRVKSTRRNRDQDDVIAKAQNRFWLILRMMIRLSGTAVATVPRSFVISTNAGRLEGFDAKAWSRGEVLRLRITPANCKPRFERFLQKKSARHVNPRRGVPRSGGSQFLDPNVRLNASGRGIKS